jgi:hypothetical protein
MTTTTDNQSQADDAGVTSRVRESATAATRRAGEALGTARTRASEAYSAARERTGEVYGTARERTAEGIESYPGGAILGGLALGALIAAVLPKTQRESEAFGQLGRRINDTAKEAARAAKEAGRSKLDEAGLNRETAQQKLSEIASTASQAARDAARTSASAAAQTVKGSHQQ